MGCNLNGLFSPTKRIEKNEVVEKSISESDEKDKKWFTINAKTMNTLSCALNANKFSRIFGCKMPIKFGTFEVTH